MTINSKFTAGFHTAGYADFQTNDAYVGGVVGQHKNFSFTRVFETGHEGILNHLSIFAVYNVPRNLLTEVL
jgi:hypothetical protein